MQMMKHFGLAGWATLALSLCAVGCGNDGDSEPESTSSGVDGALLLTALTAEDAATLCEWNAATVTGEAITCDGVEVTIEPASVEECKTNLDLLTDGCAATVKDHERCVEADPCDFIPAACLPLLACSSDAGGDFDCGDGTMGDRCDGFDDCADQSDELNCP